MSPIVRVTAWVALAVLVGLANAPTIDYGFVYDDVSYIAERQPAWQQGWTEFFGERQWGLGRHLALISLDLNRSEPLDPTPFHYTNILIAVLAALLVLELGLAIGLSAGGAIAAGALFAVHPIHVDAVVNIIGRAGSMAAIAVMGCVLLHARGYGRGFAGYAAAALLFLLGLASKEDALVLIPLLVLYDVILRPQDERVPRGAYAAYGLAGAAWLATVWGNFATVAPIAYSDNPLAHVDAWPRITRAAELLWSYAALTVWPTHLLPDRSFATTRPETVLGPLALVAWCAAIATALLLRRRAPKAAFAFLWFPAAFAVTGNVAFPIGTIMAERLAFLPSAGLCLLVGVLVSRIARLGRIAAGAMAVLVFVAVFVLGMIYDDRARVWTDEGHYHWVAAILSPDSAKAQINLGLDRARAADYETAVRAFRRALKIDPRSSASANYLAGTYGHLGRPAEAAPVWERYLLEQPDDAGAHSQVLHIYMTRGDYESALPHAQALAVLQPDEAEHIKNLVVIERLISLQAENTD